MKEEVDLRQILTGVFGKAPGNKDCEKCGEMIVAYSGECPCVGDIIFRGIYIKTTKEEKFDEAGNLLR